MDRSNATITRWLVTWMVNPQPVTGYMKGEQVTTCALAQGDTDNLEAVRRMIAIRRSLDHTRVEILAMVQIEDTDAITPLTESKLCCLTCGTPFPSLAGAAGHQHFQES